MLCNDSLFSKLGIWEYLAQSNSSADCVPAEHRFKFVDDLTVLEKINLLIVGLSSFNSRASVPNDIGDHNQFIPVQFLKSQDYLNTIKEWTDRQKMILNQNKTKVMTFNFTDNHQFSSRLTLNNEHLEIVNFTKLLGVVISDDLKWDENTDFLVKRAYACMELLRKISSFGTGREEKKDIYILYIRSILEQSCVVWHSSLTDENVQSLERVQKAPMKIILGQKYTNYEETLEKLDLQPLSERREELCLKFAKKCLTNNKVKDMFPLSEKPHQMDLRNIEKYVVKHANTERLKKSAIPFMQRLLNREYQNNHYK